LGPGSRSCALPEVVRFLHAAEPHKHTAKVPLRALVRGVQLNGTDIEISREVQRLERAREVSGGELTRRLREQMRAHLALSRGVVRLERDRGLQLAHRRGGIAFVTC